MAEFDVTKDREKYIGGSDIPVLMGISPFKTRWQLLNEKAGLETSDFEGNAYTEYGHEMETKIREYCNKTFRKNYEPDQIIDGDLRGNLDGWDKKKNAVLEIKTTSHIKMTQDVEEYMPYLVQLLFYMELTGSNDGKLAVYQRPKDFSDEFDDECLDVFDVTRAEFADVCKDISREVDSFREDLKKLKENPLLVEDDLQPNDLMEIANKVLALENQLKAYDDLQKEYKKVKNDLFEAMKAHNVKHWETINGTKITLMDGKEDTQKTETVFDVDEFKGHYQNLYNMYCKEVVKTIKGKSGYVLITPPKD